MGIKSKSYIFAGETDWETTGEGVCRQILGYDEQLMLVKVAFKKGAVGSGHTHFHSQSTYVASGIFEFHINGETQIVRTGDGIYIAPNLYHGCTCLEDGILIDTFSPVREDFLDRK
jgi:quercetin dioxygenase-like cupin family protein